MKNKIFILLLMLTLVFSLTSCKRKIKVEDYSISKLSYYMYLDTISTVTVEYNVHEKTTEEVEKELNYVNNILLDIEKEFSISKTYWMTQNNISESTLMKVNNNSGKSSVKVSDTFLKVLKEAKYIYNLTNQGFDPTIGPITKLWNIASQAEYCNEVGFCNVPKDSDILKNLELIDFNLVKINEEEKTVFLEKEGMMLDFGGIAKGFAADAVMDYLKPLGYTYISVNLGGNLILYGSSKIYEANNKKVGTEIQDPNNPSKTIIRTEESNMTLVTSGVYERYIEANGVKYHHILNPKTGYPFENELVMVSIIGSNSCICDGLSTGVFALGLEDGIKLIKNLEGYSAFFVTKDNKIYFVGNIEFELTQTGKNNYTLEIVE